MSRIVKDARLIGTKNGVELWLMHIECDTMQDLPAANAYGSNTLICIGSTAHIIVDNSTLEINSAGNWIQQQAGSSTYTRAEIDAMLSAIDAEIASITPPVINYVYGVATVIPDNSDLNNYTTPGSYYVGTSASAATIVNIPLGGSGFRLIVRNTSAGNRYRQEFIKPNNPEALYVRHFTTSGTWSPWYKFEGTEVT